MSAVLEAIDRRGVATLTLNRSARHNALDGPMVAELTDCLQRVGHSPDVRAVVLASSGVSFCAGADLGWMRRMADADDARNRRDAAGLARLMHTLDRLSKPTLCMVQGAAYGGGVGLVACCDIAVASERASFCLSEVRLGLLPATIGPYVINAIGARQARRYFLTAEPIAAARAQQIGLVHEVVAPAALDDSRDRLLHALLQGGPDAQIAAKDLVFLCEARGVDAALGEETTQRIAERRASAEGREGLSAFLDKRRPSWRQD